MKFLLTLIVIYLVCTAAYTAYRVLRHGETLPEALSISPRWPVPAAAYLSRRVREWWRNRNVES